MTFTKLPPVEGNIACLTCGCGSDDTLNPGRLIMVGFGEAGYSADDEIIWEESPQSDFCHAPTVGDVTYLASLEPKKDWRIWFYGPLYSAEYQIQDGHWVLVEKGEGFA